MRVVRRAIVFAVAVVLVAGPRPALGQQGSEGDDDGLALEIATSYVLDVDGGRVDVSMEVTARNVLDDRRDEFGVTRFYFDEVTFLVPVEATGVRFDAGRSAGELAVTPRDVGGVAELVVPLAPRLYSGETAEFVVDFSLPASPPRSSGEIRVNSAFSWFFVWAYGDPGLASVSVEVDPAFRVDVIGDHLVRTVDEAGRRVLRAERVEDPESWLAAIAAHDDRALQQRIVEVSGTTVTVRSWPGDAEWAGVVSEVVAEGIPVLEALTGLDFGPDLAIVESYWPLVNGFGGWYLEGERQIEVGEELDAQLILHEVSHSWFNSDLFGERWIVEGLAEVYAERTIQMMGGDAHRPANVGPNDQGSLPLNQWAAPRLGERSPGETDEFAYAASAQVTRALFERAGAEAMAKVLAAAAHDEIAYRGGDRPEKVGPADDWRRYLDLVEELGDTEVSDLFDQWVVSPSDRSLLDRREQVRVRYRDLEVAAGSWSLPAELRRAMAEWEFAVADALIAELAQVIELRGEVGEAAEAIGVAPPSLESEFEAGESAESLVARLAAQRLAIEELAAAGALFDRPRSLLQGVGLLWSDLETALTEGRAAISDGDLAGATSAANDVTERIQTAERSGGVRLAATAVFLVFAGISFGIVRRRRRSARPESARNTFSRR